MFPAAGGEVGQVADAVVGGSIGNDNTEAGPRVQGASCLEQHSRLERAASE